MNVFHKNIASIPHTLRYENTMKHGTQIALIEV